LEDESLDGTVINEQCERWLKLSISHSSTRGRKQGKAGPKTTSASTPHQLAIIESAVQLMLAHHLAEFKELTARSPQLLFLYAVVVVRTE
jgi:hypothetical protein